MTCDTYLVTARFMRYGDIRIPVKPENCGDCFCGSSASKHARSSTHKIIRQGGVLSPFLFRGLQKLLQAAAAVEMSINTNSRITLYVQGAAKNTPTKIHYFQNNLTFLVNFSEVTHEIFCH